MHGSESGGKIATLLLFLLIASLLLGGCSESSSPETVTEAFFEAVREGNLEKAVDCFPPSVQEEIQESTSLANDLLGINAGALVSGLADISDATGIVDWSFKLNRTEKTNSSHATVYVDVYVGDVKAGSTGIDCVRIGRKWYIDR